MYWFVKGIKKEKEKKTNCALAGSRTRIYCLEGSNADRYTTNALLGRLRERRLLFPAVLSWHIPANCLRRHTCTQMQLLASYLQNLYTVCLG